MWHLLLPSLLVLVTASLGAAQSVPEVSPALQGRVDPGERVGLTTVEGRKFNGLVVSAAATALTLSVDDGRGRVSEQSFAFADIRTVKRRDRLWNGFLIGLGAGIVGSEIFRHSLCGARGYDDECSAIVTGVGLVSILPGGIAVGMLVDKFSERTLYRAGERPLAWRVSPLVTPKRKGGVVTISW